MQVLFALPVKLTICLSANLRMFVCVCACLSDGIKCQLIKVAISQWQQQQQQKYNRLGICCYYQMKRNKCYFKYCPAAA